MSDPEQQRRGSRGSVARRGSHIETVPYGRGRRYMFFKSSAMVSVHRSRRFDDGWLLLLHCAHDELQQIPCPGFAIIPPILFSPAPARSESLTIYADDQMIEQAEKDYPESDETTGLLSGQETGKSDLMQDIRQTWSLAWPVISTFLLQMGPGMMMRAFSTLHRFCPTAQCPCDTHCGRISVAHPRRGRPAPARPHPPSAG